MKRSKDIVLSSVARERPGEKFTAAGGAPLSFDHTTPNDYIITLSGSPLPNIRAVGLLWASVPKTMYPIQTNYNDQMEFEYGGTPLIATLPSRWYVDGSDLAAEIQAQMRAATGTTDIDVTYSATFNRFTFTRTAGTTNVEIVPQGVTPAIASVIGRIPDDNTKYETGTGASPQSFNLPGSPDLTFPQVLRLNIEPYNNNVTMQQGTSQNGKFSFVVPMNVGFGELMEFESESGFYQEGKVPSVYVKQLRVSWQYELTLPGTGLAPSVDASVVPDVDFRGANHTLGLRLYC